MPDCMETAISYAARGKSVVQDDPKTKRPTFPWKEFQERIATEEEIISWWSKNPESNVGLVCGHLSDILVIDCDSQEATQIIQDLIPESLEVPSQRTPGGGTHFFFKHSSGYRGNVKKVGDHIDIRTSGNQVVIAPSTDSRGKYQWVSGDIFDIDPPALPQALVAFLRPALKQREDGLNIRPSKLPNHESNASSNNNSFSLYIENSRTDKTDNMSNRQLPTGTDNYLQDMFTKGSRNNDLYLTAIQLIKGGTEESQLFNIINTLGNSCQPPLPASEIQIILKSALKSDIANRQKPTKSIADRVRNWVETEDEGTFFLWELTANLQLPTTTDKEAAGVELKRLVAKGVLEKVPRERGKYRKVNRDLEIMDFVHASDSGRLLVEFPLDIHNKTIFLPKNVTVLAGVTGQGKSTFLFNFMLLNMYNPKFKIIYFTSEMSDLALKDMMQRFQIPLEHWLRILPISDTSWDYFNIQDKVIPTGINVIDYLEPEGGKPYEIHGVIEAIAKRLTTGMALIATQKKPGAILSAGGPYTAKRADLYLSMDWGKIHIWKNRYYHADPNGHCRTREFDIHYGRDIVPKGGWYDERAVENKVRANIYERGMSKDD